MSLGAVAVLAKQKLRRHRASSVHSWEHAAAGWDHQINKGKFRSHKKQDITCNMLAARNWQALSNCQQPQVHLAVKCHQGQQPGKRAWEHMEVRVQESVERQHRLLCPSTLPTYSRASRPSLSILMQTSCSMQVMGHSNTFSRLDDYTEFACLDSQPHHCIDGAMGLTRICKYLLHFHRQLTNSDWVHSRILLRHWRFMSHFMFLKHWLWHTVPSISSNATVATVSQTCNVHIFCWLVPWAMCQTGWWG